MGIQHAGKAFPSEERVKRFLRKHFAKVEGALSDSSKDAIRLPHRGQRNQCLLDKKPFVDAKLPMPLGRFAASCDVNPAPIKPVLQRISCDTVVCQAPGKLLPARR